MKRRRLLLLGLWLGLAYGLLEAAGFVVLSLIPGALSWRTGSSIQILWVGPLVYAAAFTVITLALAGLAALTERVRPLPWDAITVAVLGFVAAFLFATLQGQILSDLAAAVLALGIATEATRQYRRRRDRLLRMMSRSLPYLGGGVVLIAALVIGGTELRERIALDRLESEPGRPNVLLIIMDTQRGDHLSSYGYQRETTPHLDRFAAQGTLFENAFASSSWTLPTHATLMTGRPLHEHRAGVLRRPYLDDRFPTLAEYLSEQGYATGAFVANTYWAGRQTGLDRGFVRYEDFFGNIGDALARTVLGRRLAYEILPHFGLEDIPGRKRADEINRDLLDWLDRIEGRPFFAFVNYFDVHGPYLPPDPYRGRFSGTEETRRKRTGEIEIGALTTEMELPPPEEIRRMIDRYDESLLFLDAEMGRLFGQLEERGLLDRTIVIVTSDHGESWGEHGMMYHGHSLYRDQIHAPLILRYPERVPEGVRATRSVGLDQIPATIADLLGTESPFPGRSILPIDAPAEPVLIEVAQRSSVPAPWPSSRGWLAGLVTERWHFILSESGDVELYDMVADPGETTDLSQDPAFSDLVADFRSRLNTFDDVDGSRAQRLADDRAPHHGDR